MLVGEGRGAADDGGESAMRQERSRACGWQGKVARVARGAARGWQGKVARVASHGSEWYGALGGRDKNGPSDAKERKHGNGEAKISHGG